MKVDLLTKGLIGQLFGRKHSFLSLISLLVKMVNLGISTGLVLLDHHQITLLSLCNTLRATTYIRVNNIVDPLTLILPIGRWYFKTIGEDIKSLTAIIIR
jgi:hypothetical protein